MSERLTYINRDSVELLTYAGLGALALVVAFLIGFAAWLYERHRDTPVVYDD